MGGATVNLYFLVYIWLNKPDAAVAELVYAPVLGTGSFGIEGSSPSRSTMKILLVDNTSRYLDKVRALISRHDVTVVKYNQLSKVDTTLFDCVILSGGHGLTVAGHDAEYAAELQLIREFDGAVIGICLGFELIVRAFGGTLKELQASEKGLIQLTITTDNSIFRDLPSVMVYENHRWAADHVPDSLLPLAMSKDGIEAIRHRDRPIYGFQFHPELFVDVTCGDEIFRAILSTIDLKQLMSS